MIFGDFRGRRGRDVAVVLEQDVVQPLAIVVDVCVHSGGALETAGIGSKTDNANDLTITNERSSTIPYATIASTLENNHFFNFSITFFS